MTKRKTLRLALGTLLALTLGIGTACSQLDPHRCDENDIDGDGDGRCNE